MTAVRTVGLDKRYGTVHALSHVDLEVPDRAVYGLVGPNGSGKTTALEILAGLRRPTAGGVELTVSAARISYCPDTPEFEPWLTAIEVVASAAGLIGRRVPRAEVLAMLERVGLTDVAERRVGGFSRGMLTRLSIASGLIADPAVLLVDEPAAALDPAGRRDMLGLLSGLAARMAVIVSSHDLPDVERICDRVGVLVAGRLAFQGAVTELLALASYRLRIVVRPPAERLVTALREAAWVRSVHEGRPGELAVEATEPRCAERCLAPTIAACDARLVEVSRTSSLADAFFALTDPAATGRAVAEPDPDRLT